jgi:hypothetical protein
MHKPSLFQACIVNQDGTSTVYEFKSYARRKTFCKRHAHINPVILRRNGKVLPNNDLFCDFVMIEANPNRAANRATI